MFVLDDGGEVDLDLGNYERFMDVTLGRDNNITTGKIYQQVIEREVRFSMAFDVFTLARDVVIIWARRFKLYRTLRMLFKIG